MLMGLILSENCVCVCVSAFFQRLAGLFLADIIHRGTAHETHSCAHLRAPFILPTRAVQTPYIILFQPFSFHPSL